jgi:hypothetical protein
LEDNQKSSYLCDLFPKKGRRRRKKENIRSCKLEVGKGIGARIYDIVGEMLFSTESLEENI